MKPQGFLAAMAPSYPYDLDAALEDFFTLKFTNREACDGMAKNIVGGKVTPVAIQGNCSYSVYAGPESDFVVQFRPKSLSLMLENNNIARSIHGQLVPEITEVGQLGDEKNGETLVVYVMPRVKGISYLDFTRTNAMSENSRINKACRQALMKDVAMFFATCWKYPQSIATNFTENLASTFRRDLRLLADALPQRFLPTIQKCLASMESVLSLPVVFLHRDFSTANIIVSETCNLVGVLDWGEAGVCTFGQNLHFIQNLTCQLDPGEGWKPLEDFTSLQATFWTTLQDQAGLSAETTETIKVASIMGLLLYRGFTRRLANMPQPKPISEDDESGRYSMLYLDGFILNPATRIDVSD